MSIGRKAQQSESTRAELIAVARKMFAERGYADTPTEELVQAAGMTRGALYHHFKDKKALFHAVFEAVEIDLITRTGAAMDPTTDAWTNLQRGISAFLDACLEPDVQQIGLIDAPSVLGYEAWKEVEEKYGLAAVSAGLAASMAQGYIAQQALTPLAHLLLAALNEAGLMIARAPNRAAAREEVGAALLRVLEGLRAKP